MTRKRISHQFKAKYREPYGGTEVTLYLNIWTDEDGHIVSANLVDEHGSVYDATLHKTFND